MLSIKICPRSFTAVIQPREILVLTFRKNMGKHGPRSYALLTNIGNPPTVLLA